jgi:FKBP-type peptidyl-prolyl cis-trans isomerase FkpA
MKFLHYSIIAAVLLSMAACKSGPKKTKGGYEYEVTQSASGTPAKVGDFVTIYYKVTADSAKVLDESIDSLTYPIIPVSDTLPPQTVGNPFMSTLYELVKGSKVGDNVMIRIPVDSMKGAMELQAYKMINSNFIVKKIQSKADYDAMTAKLQSEMQAKQAAGKEKLVAIEELVKTTLADYKSSKIEVQKTASGLKYYIVKPGTGANAAAGNQVSVQYYGNTLAGKMFDNSFSRGEPIKFPLGAQQVIKGWDEGLALLNKGAKAFFFIPGNLAYGEQGNPQGGIGPNEELMFYVELEDFK